MMVNNEQQRVAFEASVIERNSDYEAPMMLLERNALGDYSVVRIAGEWEGWKAAIELDRQGRGEPVARIRHCTYSGIAVNKHSVEMEMLDSAPDLPDGAPLYAAPQPDASAEPLAGRISDEDRLELVGGLGLLCGHAYKGVAAALQRVLDADAAPVAAAQPSVP